MFTLENVRADLLPVAEEILDQWIPQFVEDDYYTWPMRLFNTRPSTTWSERFRSFTPTQPWSRWQENEPNVRLDWGKLEDVFVEPEVFTAEFVITELYMKYANGNINPLSLFLDDLDKYMADFLAQGMIRIPQMAAGLLLDAFSSASQPMRDGSALCANSHTDVPGDNLSTTKLSTQLLKEFSAMRVGKDVNNMPRMFNWDTLIVGPDNEDLAKQLLFSQNYPGNNDNDINPYKGRYKLEINPWLDDDIESGASQYVFALDSRRNNIRGRLLEMPHFLPPFQKDAQSFVMTGRLIFWYAVFNNAGICGSTGTVAPS